MELNENFAYSGTKQNFDRDSYATLAEMKAVKAKKMPSIFHATCVETGKLYIYNKTNTDDEILGKWREVGGSAAENEAGTSETLFNNNGPELEIYGFTQGHISSDQMFETIGNSYYARYTGDYGRGNEPFIPGNVESRADSATVYIENAPMFGTSKCRLFATNTQGQVFEGFFVTTRTEPTFTSDGLVWRKVENKNENASGSSDYLRIEDDSSAVYLISSNNKSEVSPDDIFDYTDLPFYILKDGFDSDIELKYVGDVGSAGHNGVVFASEPFLEDDSSKSASLRKLLMYTAELVTYRHAWYMINPEVKEIGSGSCECEEDTDTIDFSTWPEYTSPEANGIVLDGQGGANIDDSNISVDPDDIEEED